MAITSPLESFLEQARGVALVSPISDLPPAQPAPEHVNLVPAAIDVEWWQEDDGSWAAHVPLLGVTAVADNQADLFAETAEVVDDFWARLNERYETLSPDLKRLLDLREQPLSFQTRQ